MIPAAVASMVVAIIAANILAAKPWQKWDEAPSVYDLIRPLSISVVVLGTMATFLILCLSPGIIQMLTCFVYVLPLLSIAALVIIVVLLWRRHRHSQIAD
jgi:hypothetical protein